MADLYVHGIVVVEGTGELRAFRSPNQSTIGIVGTAHAQSTLTPETPAVFLTKKEALAAIAPDGAAGDKGTLYLNTQVIYDQGDATVVISRAKTASDADVQTAIDALLNAESITGFKPKIILAPGLGKKVAEAPKLVEESTPPVAPNPPVVNGTVTNPTNRKTA